jgi:8-amino-3,8-dideoxy-alpha-D-manno-octulosonate transaminase
MPGYEMWGAEERREVEEVLETGILMRYGFDGPRQGRWKARELEAALRQRTGAARRSRSA